MTATREAKINLLLGAAREWRDWHHRPVTPSADESRRRIRARNRLLAAIDHLDDELRLTCPRCGKTPPVPVNDTPESITCPRCAMTSYNPQDINEGYCGNCHDWTTPR